MKSSKCIIDKFTLKFCEHVVEEENIQPLTSKITIINDWLVSINVHKVHQFLDLASFYCWFIKDFTKIAALMHNLLKKSDMMLQKKKFWPIVWNAQCQLAFDCLKKALTSNPVLWQVNVIKMFIIKMNVSEWVIDYSLLQKGPDEKLYSVVYNE